MNELELLVQVPIFLFGILTIAALIANRIFLGCIFGVIAQPFWFFSAYQAEQWGVVVVLAAYFIIYALGIIVRWPRKAPVKEIDEHEWLTT